MVDQMLRHLACDRCGHGWTGPATQQPDGWSGVGTFHTPLGSDQQRRFHLCQQCSHDHQRFLDNWEVTRRG